jgi:hypothetical protein
MKILNCNAESAQWMADNYSSLDGDLDGFSIRSASLGIPRYAGGVKYAEGFVRALDAFRGMLCERVLRKAATQIHKT